MLVGVVVAVFLIGGSSAEDALPICDALSLGSVLGLAGSQCSSSLVAVVQTRPFGEGDCACLQNIPTKSVETLGDCVNVKEATMSFADLQGRCVRLAQAVKAPEFKSTKGTLQVLLPVNGDMVVTSGGDKPVVLNGLGPRMENAEDAISNLDSYLQGNVSAAAMDRKNINVTITTMNSTVDDKFDESTKKMEKIVQDFDKQIENAQKQLDNLTKVLNEKTAQLKDLTDVNAANHGKLNKSYVDSSSVMTSRVGFVEDETRYVGANLVKAANLMGTKEAGWVQPLDDKLAEQDTFLDGFPIRATTSREVGGGGGSKCYPGWGQTNKFKVDPQKTYEFSIWIRSTVHQSKMNNYFGFFLFSGDGKRITENTPHNNYGNPYFKSSESDSSEWTKYYGYLIGTSFTNCTLYKRHCVNNVNKLSRDNMFYVMHPKATHALLRFGSCYAENNGNDNTKYTMPMVRELDFLRANAALRERHSFLSNNVRNTNLVRHSNLVNTNIGTQKTAYGGDTWLGSPVVKLAMFDGFGEPFPAVVARSYESGSTGCYSGWGHTNFIKVDVSRRYEFSIWIKSNDPGMHNYFGFHAYDSRFNRIGGLYGNPYFKCTASDSEDWTQYKGYLVPRSVHNIRNSQCGLAHNNADTNYLSMYQLNSNVRYVTLRFGSCYSNGDARGETLYAFPHVKEMDGK